MTYMIYFLGEIDAKSVIVGGTQSDELRRKVHDAQRDYGSQFDLLAAVPATTRDLDRVTLFFASQWVSQADERDTDAYAPAPELIEYVNWLRQQWFTTLDLDEVLTDEVGFNEWEPTKERRVERPPQDPTKLFETTAMKGPLAQTEWEWMSTPDEIGEDYYTPPEIVHAARRAMGDVDLDPASHHLANRRLRVPVIYHRGRSAFDNPWVGRVWLNPPHEKGVGYGPWFDKIVYEHEKGNLDQLCMIAPAWAFTTRRSEEFMSRVSAIVVMSPTPNFWGSPKGTGSNHPHFVVYVGDRVDEFLDAFEEFGIPVEIRSRERVA